MKVRDFSGYFPVQHTNWPDLQQTNTMQFSILSALFLAASAMAAPTVIVGSAPAAGAAAGVGGGVGGSVSLDAGVGGGAGVGAGIGI